MIYMTIGFWIILTGTKHYLILTGRPSPTQGQRVKGNAGKHAQKNQKVRINMSWSSWREYNDTGWNRSYTFLVDWLESTLVETAPTTEHSNRNTEAARSVSTPCINRSHKRSATSDTIRTSMRTLHTYPFVGTRRPGTRYKPRVYEMVTLGYEPIRHWVYGYPDIPQSAAAGCVQEHDMK